MKPVLFPARDWSWATKLALLLISLAILPLGVLTLYGEGQIRRELLNDSRARNLQRATNTAALVGRYLEDAVADISIVARSPAAVRALEHPSDAEGRRMVSAVLHNFKATKSIERLYVTDRMGTIVAATDPALVGGSRIASPFFLSAAAGRTQVLEPNAAQEDHGSHLHVSGPVRDAAGRIIGVVAARFLLNQLDALIAADSNFGGYGEYGLLWDERGILLADGGQPGRRFRPLGRLLPALREQMVAEARYGPDTAALLSGSLGGEALVERARWRLYDDRHDPHVDVALAGGELLQVTSVPVRGQRWTYAIAVPQRSLLAAIRAQSVRNISVAVFTALAALGLALLAARWLLAPLRRVADAARALAAGDMSHRVDLRTKDEIGELAAAFDSMADALARKEAELREYADSLESSVAERTAELRGLLAAIPDVIFKLHRDGRILTCSAARATALLFPAERVLGRRVQEMLPPEVADPTCTAIERVLAGEAYESFEYRLSLRGEPRYFEARMSASGPDEVVAVVRDITERRRADERERFLATAGAALSSSLDYGGTLETLTRLVVPSHADVCMLDLVDRNVLAYGAIAASDSALESRLRALRLQDRVTVEGDHPSAVALRTGVPRVLRRLGPADGAILAMLGPGAALVQPLVTAGRRIGVMTLVRREAGRPFVDADLSMIGELAQRAGVALENARLYRALQESNRLKDEFLGIVSHELRTPLNAVLGWAQVLRRGTAEPAQAARALDAIERNARAQARLIEDLLDTSRIVSGKLHIQFAPVDIRTVARAAVDSFRPLAAARSISLEADLDEDLPTISADVTRLQQVIGNLLSNALKFTPEGGRIRLDLHRRGMDLELVVADTGIGISPEFLPHVFDRFRQADSTTTRAHGGLGIGLAIARHLVELHGGTIHASSLGENRGTAVTVLLPIIHAALVEVSGASALSVPVLQGLRILVVDDEGDTRDLVATLLSGAGARVRTAGSVREALESLRAARPDLLVTDIGMPGEDGYALLRAARAADAASSGPRMLVLALTAYAREEDAERARRAGFDGYLSKPIEADALVEAVRSLAHFDQRSTL